MDNIVINIVGVVDEYENWSEVNQLIWIVNCGSNCALDVIKYSDEKIHEADAKMEPIWSMRDTIDKLKR